MFSRKIVSNNPKRQNDYFPPISGENIWSSQATKSWYLEKKRNPVNLNKTRKV